MQIKDLAVLEVEVKGSSELTISEIKSLLYRSFPKGFRDNMPHTIEQKKSFNTKGNYVVQLEVPRESRHIGGIRYTPETFDAALRDTLARFQDLVNQYQQYREFHNIEIHRGVD